MRRLRTKFSRFGQFTRNGRSITISGVKPFCPYIQDFRNTYLFGAFSPINGTSLLLEMPCCDTDCFEVFLEELSKQDADEFKVLFLDNGAFHKATRLVIPDNIALCFIPPYSPELNPAEKVWAFIKKRMTNIAFDSIKKLQDFLDQIIRKELNAEIIKSITHTSLYLNEIYRHLIL